ncbi:hypothetical protein J27TS8_20480 [Robertmurraya siralis]|uniref:DUF3188 domain-containing protein n=1 Tax=Robertmurraya siralis TaxID=77777 RepID=A0A919WHE9_9BACI|nr:hypothetical protein [Robertmurraya siralis]GIN62055.1 hypothetical protein J27TS8_20480 [Robertmurraya siralis]
MPEEFCYENYGFIKRMIDVVKRGLFLLSIGCLLFLFSANAKTGEYEIFNLTTALVLVIVGAIMALQGKKRNNTQKD